MKTITNLSRRSMWSVGILFVLLCIGYFYIKYLSSNWEETWKIVGYAHYGDYESESWKILLLTFPPLFILEAFFFFSVRITKKIGRFKRSLTNLKFILTIIPLAGIVLGFIFSVFIIFVDNLPWSNGLLFTGILMGETLIVISLVLLYLEYYILNLIYK